MRVQHGYSGQNDISSLTVEGGEGRQEELCCAGLNPIVIEVGKQKECEKCLSRFGFCMDLSHPATHVGGSKEHRAYWI